MKQLKHLSIDAARGIMFGPMFYAMKNFTSLKLQGRCNINRILRIKEHYVQHTQHLERLDLSTIYKWVKVIPFSLQYIESHVISFLNKLTFLDLSFNRQLGLCGLQNVTNDLNSTKIVTLKANY